MTIPQLVFLDADSVGDDIEWPDFSVFGKVVSYEYTTKNQTRDRVKDAELLFTNKVLVNAECIASAPKLRYIGVLATGYNQVNGAAAAERGILVCNVPNYSTNAVVQHVFTLILSLCSRVCDLAASVRGGNWAKSRHFCYWDTPIAELHGKTLGIVGFGDIGSRVARVGHAFGMEILAYAPRPKPAPAYAPFAFAELAELFRRSDVVSLHCPLTSEHAGMVNASLLGTMKRSAILINTARGSLVDEAALLDALQRGVISGAGLDVVTREPMPDDNPLRLAPNCIITPHVAWSSVEARTRLMRGVHDNVARFLAGRPVNVTNGGTL